MTEMGRGDKEGLAFVRRLWATSRTRQHHVPEKAPVSRNISKACEKRISHRTIQQRLFCLTCSQLLVSCHVKKAGLEIIWQVPDWHVVGTYGQVPYRRAQKLAKEWTVQSRKQALGWVISKKRTKRLCDLKTPGSRLVVALGIWRGGDRAFILVYSFAT